jgi:hypothetical protein
MSVPWYEWRHIRNRLLAHARAVQGVSPYRVVLEPDRSKCPSGYTNFSQRLIMVNPTMFEVTPEEQYQLTKAVLCHEAGHRRFTTPSTLPSHVHFVANILEDDRVERVMEEEFAGVRSLLKKLSEELLNQALPLDPASEDPTQVLSYILQLRWAVRSGLWVKGELSPGNWSLWEQVSPLVQEAWSAESSLVCDRNAHEIIRILGITEPDIPQWLKELLEKLEAVEGTRGPGDVAENAAPRMDSPFNSDGADGEAFDGEPVPHEHGAGTAEHLIEPQPYLELVDKVQPLVKRLVEELAVEDAAPPPGPAERGGRLSLRQHLRDPERPFILPPEDRPPSPTLAFRLVIDHSTSMNFEGRMEYAAQAAMLLHLAAVELAIPHQIIVAPDDIHIAGLDSPVLSWSKEAEMGLALIAGLVPAQTGWEDTGLAVSRHGAELAAMPQDIKLLLVIHDGMGNDYELLARECKKLRHQVLILGLGLGMGDVEAGLLKEQFGPDRYIHCERPEELPAKVDGLSFQRGPVHLLSRSFPT